LKKIENKNGFLEAALSRNDKKKIPFFYMGANNNWKKILKDDFKTKLDLKFHDNLKELNY